MLILAYSDHKGRFAVDINTQLPILNIMPRLGLLCLCRTSLVIVAVVELVYIVAQYLENVAM